MSLPSLPEKPKLSNYGGTLGESMPIYRRDEMRYYADCARVWRELAMEAMKYARHEMRCDCWNLVAYGGRCDCGLDALQAHIAGITPREE